MCLWARFTELPLSISHSISASEGPPTRPRQTHVPLCLLDWLLGGFLVLGNSSVHIHADLAHKRPLPKFIWERPHKQNVKVCFFPQQYIPPEPLENTLKLKSSRKHKWECQGHHTMKEQEQWQQTAPNSVSRSRFSTDYSSDYYQDDDNIWLRSQPICAQRPLLCVRLWGIHPLMSIKCLAHRD